MTKSKPSPTQAQVTADFDRLTDDYEAKINSAIAFGGREHQFYIDVKRDHIVRLAAGALGPLDRLDALDLGCGIGAYHRGLEGRFRQLHGVDVSSKSIAVARARHPLVRYESFDGRTLPYPDRRFDIVFAICVMHHVPPTEWRDFVAETKRVLKKDGLALIFEHNPYNPATQYIVRSCDIDKDAVLLRPGAVRAMFRDAGFEQVRTRAILSLPLKGPFLTKLDDWLGALSLGAQYYLSARKGARAAPSGV